MNEEPRKTDDQNTSVPIQGSLEFSHIHHG